jgi:ParB family transcriptional regulator, chromosome partitioning protein
MARTARGGLGRGLGALIPTGPVIRLGGVPTGTPPPDTPDADDTSAGTVSVATAAAPSAAANDDSYPAPPTDTAQSGSYPARPDETDQLAAPSESDVESENGTDPAAPTATFAELDVRSIRPNARQPRQVFDEESLTELTHSIREFGMLQPLVVRSVGDGYELVMGERRLRAAVAAGLDVVPAIVRHTADNAMLRDALLENIHRVALNPLEEAAAYHQLLEEFGATHEELAERIGRSRSQVTNTIRLMNLSLPVQRRVAAGVLSAGHARALLALDDADAQEELAARIVAEGLSVRATEEHVAVAATAGNHRRQRPRGQRITAPALGELAERLSDTLDTRVTVELGRRKGKIQVEFASVDDLERIVALIAPSLATVHRPLSADLDVSDPSSLTDQAPAPIGPTTGVAEQPEAGAIESVA